MNMITYMFHHDSSCFIGGLGPAKSLEGVPNFQHLCQKTSTFLTSFTLLTLKERLGPHVLAIIFLVFHLGWLNSSHTSLLKSLFRCFHRWQLQPRLSLAIITSATKPQVGL